VGSCNSGGKGASNGTLSSKLSKIKVDDRWAYQPDDMTDPNDLRKNPIPYVGIENEYEIGNALENNTHQEGYKSNYEIPISKLETLQPFVLASGIDNYKSWDGSERPYVAEYKGHYYLLDGNHRASIAKLKGQKTIKVDLSIRKDK
jgi:hypothetical protein